MQPGVTVVLATVWLVVYANAVGTATHRPSRLTLDQYSPSHRHHRRHGVYGGTDEDQLGWKDRNPVEDHRVHASIPQSRSQNKLPAIHETDSKEDPFKDLDFVIYRGYGKNVNSYFSPLSEDARQSSEFTEEDDDAKESREPPELEDPFVADDTFQDQGPGSVEIYKLDLLLLDPTPASRLPFKSKAPKKTWHWKGKEPSPNMLRKQSNAIPLEESRTENSAFNDPFSVGGVPELQVGCEGLEASDPTSREKRSIDVSKGTRREVDPWLGVTPITLDSDYEQEEDSYEETDELLKLKKLETTTVGVKRNRGDMEATLDFHRDEVDSEKLPVRGDLGKSTGSGNESEPEGKSLHFNKAKRDTGAREEQLASRGGNQRKILWLHDPEVDTRSRDVWGFAEDEGVVSSDELQTVNQRRRLAHEQRLREEEERRRREEERRRREHERRSYAENRTNTDIEKIREEYERSLELKRRQDEERRRRLQQETQRPTNRWQTEEERSRMNRWQDEERRRQELESRRRYDPRTYEEERKRQQQQAEEMRRHEENRLREQERQSWLREQAEARRRESDRRNLEARNREWMTKQRQEEEEKRRREQQARSEPSNLTRPSRVGSNDTGSYDRETERRLWEQRERERQRKLNEYIERNRPINANDSIDRRREEAKRRREEEERARRLEEERRLQEYIRRNQPVRVSKVNESDGRGFEYRRRPDEARDYNRSRYPGPGSGRRNHGPSAPTNIDPWTAEAGRREAERRRIEEERNRERQRKAQEDLRREALRREEEQRRMQSRRYEEQRKRQQAERLAREEQEKARRRSQLGERRRFPEPGRRQDTSLIPANLVSNEERRAAERQRQEMERKRLEAERQRHEQARPKETRQNQQRATHLKELWRRQEEARLNALPVSARIIVKPSSVPNVLPRMGGDTEIDFPGVSPHRPGVPVANFPSPPTQRPPAKSPPLCVWAVVHCCTSVTNNRLVLCFETMGCPGVNWDPNPCRVSVLTAARDQVQKFFAENDDIDSRDFH